jgi:CRISPR/Cas system CSM-associated protein Csm3 (group 7 of RAMP superfamily)
MDIIIRKGKPKGRVRSEVEKKLGKEGWGTGLTEEQIDKCEYLEREVKDKYGADKSFFKQHHVDKVE